MAQFQVTDPQTGRQLVLEGDSPPTQAELEEIFGRFQVQEVTPQQQAFQELAQETGPLEAFQVGIGRGLVTLGRGLGLVGPETETERQALEALREERPISFGGGEIVGETAPFAAVGAGPVARFGTTLARRVGASTGLGALESGIIARGQTGDEAEALEAAGLGGVFAVAVEFGIPAIGRIAGPFIRRQLGRSPTTPVLDANGRPSRELQQALDRTGLSLDDFANQTRQQLQTADVQDPAALARQRFLEQQGITPTRAQVTGEAADFQTQQELAKTSGRVRRALEAQEEVIQRNFENAVGATGGSAFRSNSPVIDFIADRSLNLDAAISDAYRAAREAAPVEQVVRPNQLVEGIRAIAGSDRATGGLASAARDILRTRGVLAPGRGLRIQGRVNAETAEEIRKDLNALFDSLTPFGRRNLADLKDALDNDVAAAVGEDVFAGARAAKAQFERDLSRAKVNKFDTRRFNLVRDILENRISPDRFLDEAVLSRRTRSSDLEQLKRFLLLDNAEGGPGLQAWNDLRAEAMEFIRETATREVGGQPAVTRAGLERAIDRLGRDKIRVLFNQDERRFLTDLTKLTQLREPVRGTAIGRGPSAQAIGRLEQTVKRIPVLAQIFEGIATDTAGRIVVRPPDLDPLLPTPGVSTALPAVTPAVSGLVVDEEEDQR